MARWPKVAHPRQNLDDDACSSTTLRHSRGRRGAGRVRDLAGRLLSAWPRPKVGSSYTPPRGERARSRRARPRARAEAPHVATGRPRALHRCSRARSRLSAKTPHNVSAQICELIYRNPCIAETPCIVLESVGMFRYLNPGASARGRPSCEGIAFRDEIRSHFRRGAPILRR